MQSEKVLELLRKKGTLGVCTLGLVGAMAFASYKTSYPTDPDRGFISVVEDETENENQEGKAVTGQNVIAEKIQDAGDITNEKILDAEFAGLGDGNSDGFAVSGSPGENTGEVTMNGGSEEYLNGLAMNGGMEENVDGLVTNGSSEENMGGLAMNSDFQENMGEQGPDASTNELAVNIHSEGLTQYEAEGIENQEYGVDGMDFDEATEVNSMNIQAEIQPTVSFQEESFLTWPAAGTILMDYSMNGTVYFKTLNQYKYNPALILGSDVGNPVVASAKGIINSIETDDETGTTLTMNIGNDYSLVYGQLKDITVSEGDVVEQGDILGYVNDPTKYYCEEGANLYFGMKKNGQPVDPMLYLES